MTALCFLAKSVIAARAPYQPRKREDPAVAGVDEAHTIPEYFNTSAFIGETVVHLSRTGPEPIPQSKLPSEPYFDDKTIMVDVRAANPRTS